MDIATLKLVLCEKVVSPTDLQLFLWLYNQFNFSDIADKLSNLVCIDISEVD